MKKRMLSFTVGLTTCYGDISILETIKSIRASVDVPPFPIILIADRVPLSNRIKKALKKHRVTFIENKQEASQVAKQKQILKLTKTDLLILTQDDVLLDKVALREVITRFSEERSLTMVSILNKPLAPQTFFEKIIGVGTNLANLQAKYWKNGDNYLSVIGRFMAFRTTSYKKFRLLDSVATSDTYYYLENKRIKGKYEYLNHVSVNFINPRTLKEHLRKSSRFQFSHDEMGHYFKSLDSEYKVPGRVVVRSLFDQFVSSPLKATAYFLVFAYTRLHKMKKSTVLNPIWEVDVSTKNLNVQKYE